MTSRSVFVGGVSGAGKTTCIKAALKGTSARHLRAGELIRSRLGYSGPYRRPPVRDEKDADRFQRLLIEQFHEEKRASDDVVLDGHFVVPTESGPNAVGHKVFEALGLTHIMLLQAPAAVIAERLRKRDPIPKWWDGSTAMLEDLLKAETLHAEGVARQLGLPLCNALVQDDLKRAIAVALEAVGSA